MAVPLRFGAGGLGLLEPWLLLLTRVWLAQAFLSLQVSTMFEVPRDLAATLTGVWWIDIVRQVALSGLGAAVQAVCPVLLIVGLANRPVAVLMIVQVVLLRSAPETLTVFWVVLLFCVLIRGAGRLSLDEMFGRGAAESALPGARPVATLYAWLGRRGTPFLLLALRLLAASVLLLRSGRPLVPSDDLLHHAMAMLPSAPGLAASLPVAFGLAGASFLVGGLATRLIAFGFLLLAPVGTATIASDIAYWALLLGFLVVDGAGSLAIDPWLDERLSGMLPAPPAGAHRVVVVGAGFAGCSAALGLGGTIATSR